MKSVKFFGIFFVAWSGLVSGEKKYGKFNGKFKDREPQRSNKMRRMLQRRQMKYPPEVIVHEATNNTDDIVFTLQQVEKIEAGFQCDKTFYDANIPKVHHFCSVSNTFESQ